MATTRIMPLHVGKGRTESRAISDIIDYVANPKKTDDGRLITGYACDSRTVDAEFLLAKRQYIAATGRVRGADDVIAYHVRQSFRPGEITQEEANRLGVEFAKRFTKGNHAFVVCTHIDKSHILIIDDDRELCALIKRSVQAENIEADFCNTGKEGLQKLREQEYQLVVLDVMMPGMDGFETLEEIRKENSLPILMFTSKNDSISKVRGLRAGADDYLTKPFDMDELIARIASLIRRYTRFNQQAGAIQKLNFDGLQIDLENRSVTTSNGTFELPPKEFDLLLYCAKHQGKILTKQQIYEEVWGEEYFYDDSNIMAIISRLRKKLEVNPSSPKYIQTVKGIGYRFNKEV